MKIDYKEMITILFDKIEGVRVEKVTAGSKFRLMGLVADVTEVNETLAKDVLEVVSHEAVLDADTEIDYAELAERVLATELTAPKEGSRGDSPLVRGMFDYKNLLDTLFEKVERMRTAFFIVSSHDSTSSAITSKSASTSASSTAS